MVGNKVMTGENKIKTYLIQCDCSNINKYS